MSLLFLLLFLFLFGIAGILALTLCPSAVVGYLLSSVVLLESMQVAQHRIDSGHHILGVVRVLRLIGICCGVSLLLAALHAAGAAGDVLGVFLSSEPLQCLVQIFELLVLFLS